jgi:hypothetical protein
MYFLDKMTAQPSKKTFPISLYCGYVVVHMTVTMTEMSGKAVA